MNGIELKKDAWIEPDVEERERLYILIEELNEAQQVFSAAQHIAMKVLRFGFDEVYPKTQTDNRERLEQELGDVLAVIEMMVRAGDVSEARISKASEAKNGKLKHFTRNQT